MCLHPHARPEYKGVARKTHQETHEMQLLLLFALAMISAILFNWGTPKFAATTVGQKFVGSYFKTTLGTAIVFFLVIYGSALLLSIVSSPRLPTVTDPVP